MAEGQQEACPTTPRPQQVPWIGTEEKREKGTETAADHGEDIKKKDTEPTGRSEKRDTRKRSEAEVASSQREGTYLVAIQLVLADDFDGDLLAGLTIPRLVDVGEGAAVGSR